MAVASVIYSLPVVFQTLLLSIVQSFNRWVIFQPEKPMAINLWRQSAHWPAARERLWGLLSSAVEPMREDMTWLKALPKAGSTLPVCREVNSQLHELPIASTLRSFPADLVEQYIISQLSIIFKAIAEDDDAISSFLYDEFLSSKDKKGPSFEPRRRGGGEVYELDAHIVRAKDYLLVAGHSHFSKTKVINMYPPWLREKTQGMCYEAQQSLVMLSKATNIIPVELLVSRGGRLPTVSHQKRRLRRHFPSYTRQGRAVALKRLRSNFMEQSYEERMRLLSSKSYSKNISSAATAQIRMLCKEVGTWNKLSHRWHLLPLLGIDLRKLFLASRVWSLDAGTARLPRTWIVIRWQMQDRISTFGQLVPLKHSRNLYVGIWGCTSLSEFLHSQKVVHGDLRGVL